MPTNWNSIHVISAAALTTAHATPLWPKSRYDPVFHSLKSASHPISPPRRAHKKNGPLKWARFPPLFFFSLSPFLIQTFIPFVPSDRRFYTHHRAIFQYKSFYFWLTSGNNGTGLCVARGCDATHFICWPSLFNRRLLWSTVHTYHTHPYKVGACNPHRVTIQLLDNVFTSIFLSLGFILFTYCQQYRATSHYSSDSAGRKRVFTHRVSSVNPEDEYADAKTRIPRWRYKSRRQKDE